MCTVEEKVFDYFLAYYQHQLHCTLLDFKGTTNTSSYPMLDIFKTLKPFSNENVPYLILLLINPLKVPFLSNYQSTRFKMG
jgi:hypothetical protein